MGGAWRQRGGGVRAACGLRGGNVAPLRGGSVAAECSRMQAAWGQRGGGVKRSGVAAWSVQVCGSGVQHCRGSVEETASAWGQREGGVQLCGICVLWSGGSVDSVEAAWGLHGSCVGAAYS